MKNKLLIVSVQVSLFCCCLFPAHIHAKDEELNLEDVTVEELLYNWSWDKKDLKKIAKLEKKIKTDSDGLFIYDTDEFAARSAISERFTAELAYFTLQFFDVFPKVFSVPPAGKVMSKFIVTIYGSRKEYLSSTSAPPWAAGHFQPDFHSPGWPKLSFYGYAEAPEGVTAEFCEHFSHTTLQHESTHAILQRYAGRSQVPIFFNEGCATYFENWNLHVDKPNDQERFLRMMRGYHMEAVVEKLRKEPNYRPNMKHHLLMDHSEYQSGELHLHYGLAESLVDFLLSTKKGRKIFKDMVKESYGRMPQGRIKQILDDKTINKLEPDWHAHLQEIVKVYEANSKVWFTDGDTIEKLSLGEALPRISSIKCDLAVNDMPVSDVFEKLSEQAKVKLLPGLTLPRKKAISLNAEKMDLQTLLKEIAKQCGIQNPELRYRGAARSLIVMPQEAAK